MTLAEATRWYRAAHNMSDGLYMEVQDAREALMLASTPYAHAAARTQLTEVEVRWKRAVVATKEARKVRDALRYGLQEAS